MSKQISVIAVCAWVMMACGSSQSGSTSDGAAQSDTCAGHGVTDACMNEANFARCQELEASCPGEVLSLESCPLQFACPS